MIKGLHNANEASSRGLRPSQLPRPPSTLQFRMVARIGPKKPHRLYLREWRLKRGLSQDQLAARLDTSKGQVSNWENRKRELGFETQCALADALGIEPGDLTRDPDAPSADELLRHASPETRRQAFALIETLLKTSVR